MRANQDPNTSISFLLASFVFILFFLSFTLNKNSTKVKQEIFIIFIKQLNSINYHLHHPRHSAKFCHLLKIRSKHSPPSKSFCSGVSFMSRKSPSNLKRNRTYECFCLNNVDWIGWFWEHSTGILKDSMGFLFDLYTLTFDFKISIFLWFWEKRDRVTLMCFVFRYLCVLQQWNL